MVSDVIIIINLLFYASILLFMHRWSATCGAKLQKIAEWAANHSNYNAVLAYGGVTGSIRCVSHHAPPTLLFLRGYGHIMSNIGKFSVEGLQSCGPSGVTGLLQL